MLATNTSASSATLQAVVNPNGAATAVFFSYGTNVQYGFTNLVLNVGSQPGLVLVTNFIQNLRLGALYHFQVSATNTAGAVASADQTFLAAGAPYAATDFASNITTTGSATLRGTAYPNGADSTAWFQWGATTNYGSVTPPLQLAATNLTVIAISNTLSGLAPGTVWHYQLLVSNSFGVTLGGDVSFVSPGLPVISAQSVSSPSPSSATFSASIFPDGLDTTAWFQYGANTNYGSSTATTLVGGGNSTPVNVASSIGGLSPGVAYHFRTVASNVVGVAYGPDEAFTTVVFTNYYVPGANFGFGVQAWADYDGDGWLDIAVSGSLIRSNQFYNETEIWRNTGNGFTNVDNSLAGHSGGSIAWSDFDNDGKPDLFVTSGYYGNEFSIVYRNTGNGFVDYADLPGLTRNWAHMECGDFNNDGHPDILINGISPPSACTTELWQNTGTNFNSFDPGLPHLMSGAMAWGDFDNDGLLDLLVAGVRCDAPGEAIEVWRNAGTGFVNMNVGLPGLYYGSVAWGDYDNDGRLDILICGTLDGSTFLTQVWHNDGNGHFSNINAGLPGVVGTAAWGDYDNDGRLDILLAGQQSTTTTDYILQVWRNTGAGFVNINASFPNVYASAAIWGDFNNDGRLDILTTGGSPLWQNVCPVSNTPPTSPTGLTASTTNSNVRLSWNAASDAQTPAAGLSYNIRVGTHPGGVDVVSPLADPLTGFRRVVGLGNAQMNRFALLNGLAPGRYYWSVQAIDTAFAGSPFAAEAQFTIGSTPPPAFGPLTLQSGVLTVRCTGQPQISYTVHTSTSLVNWTVLTNLTADNNGQFQFSVPVSGASRAAFFRLSQP